MQTPNNGADPPGASPAGFFLERPEGTDRRNPSLMRRGSPVRIWPRTSTEALRESMPAGLSSFRDTRVHVNSHGATGSPEAGFSPPRGRRIPAFAAWGSPAVRSWRGFFICATHDSGARLPAPPRSRSRAGTLPDERTWRTENCPRSLRFAVAHARRSA